jgi:hypothetical protein
MPVGGTRARDRAQAFNLGASTRTPCSTRWFLSPRTARSPYVDAAETALILARNGVEFPAVAPCRHLPMCRSPMKSCTLRHANYWSSEATLTRR